MNATMTANVRVRDLPIESLDSIRLVARRFGYSYTNSDAVRFAVAIADFLARTDNQAPYTPVLQAARRVPEANTAAKGNEPAVAQGDAGEERSA